MDFRRIKYLTKRINSVFMTTLEEIKRCDNKKSVLQQAHEIISLYKRYRCAPIHYFEHGLYEVGADKYMEYIPERVIAAFQGAANPKVSIGQIANKVNLAILLKSRGISCIPFYFYIDAEGGIWSSPEAPLGVNDAIEFSYGTPLFVKAISGQVGEGAMRLSAGGGVDKSALLSLRDRIFQPIIINHGLIAKVNPDCLNTVRIDTLVQNGEAFVNAAIIKFGQAGSITDHYAHGSIVVGIDLETGKLQDTGVTKAKYGRNFYDKHPQSGVLFKDIQIPFWPRLVELVKLAALAVQPNMTIGWDVAVTPDGPMIVEANQAGDVFMLQDAWGPLGKTKLGETALAYWLNRFNVPGKLA